MKVIAFILVLVVLSLPTVGRDARNETTKITASSKSDGKGLPLSSMGKTAPARRTFGTQSTVVRPKTKLGRNRSAKTKSKGTSTISKASATVKNSKGSLAHSSTGLEMVVSQQRRKTSAVPQSSSATRQIPRRSDVQNHNLPLSPLDSCLTMTQRSVLDFVEIHAKKEHELRYGYLLRRAMESPVTVSIKRCLDYIREDAPIIVHLKKKNLIRLANDTHYRNSFETKTRKGTQASREYLAYREAKEHSLFGGFYDSASPFERPKYGCLNITGDIRGVPAARTYGPIFLTLKPEVRLRSTFHYDNSTKGSPANLGTNNHFAHILDQFSDSDFEAVLQMSQNRIRGSPSRSKIYVEVQIHGPVRLSRDVQSISVPGKEVEASLELKTTLARLQRMTKCNVLWQGDLLDG